MILLAGANIEKTKDVYVYFLYSETQHTERTNVEKSISRVFVPGTVVINGRKRLFTEISRKPSNRYPDCKVVAEGYRTLMTYTNTSSR